MKYIVYYRHSARPKGECESIENQISIIEQWATRQGVKIADKYEDRAISGASADRPGLWAAILALAPGDVLVAWRWDRIARDVFLSEKIVRDVAKAKASIVTVEGEVNTCEETPENKALRQMMQVIGELERSITAARTRAAMLAQQRGGKLFGDYRRPPYGYAADAATRRLHPLRDEQEVIAVVINLHRQGLCVESIRSELRKKNIKPRNNGKSWHLTTLRGIIKRTT